MVWLLGVFPGSRRGYASRGRCEPPHPTPQDDLLRKARPSYDAALYFLRLAEFRAGAHLPSLGAHATASPPRSGTGNLMKHGDTTAAFDPLHALLERSGVRLCALAYMITGDWDLGIDAVARFLDAGLKNDALSEAPPLCTARRLVAAEAVAAIRPQLSAARIAGMTADPEEWLG